MERLGIALGSGLSPTDNVECVEAALPTVSDEIVASLTPSGTKRDVRERIAQYRRSGIALPIIMPVATAADTVADVASVIRACAG
jgi:hypothetical protein